MDRIGTRTFLSRLEKIFDLLQILSSDCNCRKKIAFLELEKILLLIKLDLLSRKILSTPAGFMKTISVNTRKEEMKNLIFQSIASRGDISSKEVYELFPGVNKREIRRILANLIEDQKITKISSKNLTIYAPKSKSIKPL